MVIIRVCVLVLLVACATGDAVELEEGNTDVLINMVQWTKSSGGNDHWYAICPKDLVWHTANYLARTYEHNGQHGYLACISSRDENDFILNSVISGKDNLREEDEFWIGGLQSDGKWTWVSTELWSYENFQSGTTTANASKNCLKILAHQESKTGGEAGTWHSEIKKGMTASGPKFWSVIEFDDDYPIKEAMIHLRQWPESEGGNGHWYAVIPRGVRREAAATLAKSLHVEGQRGYLATVCSQEENDFILNSVLKGTNQSSFLDAFWLGGVDNDGLWTWETGESFEFTNWTMGKLDNVGIETAMTMWGHKTVDPRRMHGTWNNALPARMPYWSVVEFGGTTSVDITPTMEWINIYCQSPTLDGKPLLPGTTILAYDSDNIACGMDTVRADGSFGFLLIYRDDPTSDEDEGADSGDLITLTVDGTPVSLDPPLLWTSNGDIIETGQMVTVP